MMRKSIIAHSKQALIKDINLSSLGWELALPIFAGAVIGYLIDRRFNSPYYFCIGLIVLGIGIGYYNIYKTIEIEHLRSKTSPKRELPEEPS
jgi:predicted F0F1-ATPase subunit